MSLIDRAVSLLAPHECLGCGRQPDLICYDCCKQLPLAPSQRLSDLTIHSRTTYDGLAKDLIWCLKFGSAQAAAKIIAIQLIVPQGNWLLIPVPTTASRRRQRGYDQAELIARQLARRSGFTSVNVLARLGNQRQVGANRQQRHAQLSQAFRLKKPDLIKGRNLLLIDDVVTTGATLEAAAQALKVAGAGQIQALTFAQA